MSEPGVFLIPALAVLAPLFARSISPWVKVPIVVFELLLGIAIGPSLLGWVDKSDLLDWLSEFGLAALFFVAGNEIRFRSLGGGPLAKASLAWVLSLAMGIAAGLLIAPGEAGVIIAIALSSTALGALIPILRDAGELSSPFGKATTAMGAVGEFGPLVAISVFLGTRSPGVSALVLALFVVVTGVAILVAVRLKHGHLHRLVNASLHTSGQFAVRIVIFTLACLVALSAMLDLDILLGAFAAGVMWQIIMRSAPEADREQVESKIEAIAFGFLVPLFFIYTGVTFNLDALLGSVQALILLPVFLGLLLIIRGLPAQLTAPKGTSPRERASLGLLSSTALPIIVAVTAIGVDQKVLEPAIASSLVGAGMLLVLFFPLIGMALRPADAVRDEAARS
ncbi:cation:proton antiporter [Pseudoclavibacter helvolus]|uniref:cation:proton antiporter n=1 Tax=Pseudoclavibacter helvolus TaxID=255205 RepID=UPI003C77514C